MGIFVQIGRMRPEEDFAMKLEENPFYPFQRDEGGNFVYKVRYARFYVACVCAVLSLLAIVIFIATEVVTRNSFFVYPIAGLVVSSIVGYWYKDIREYILNNDQKMYTFRVGKRKVVVGAYHNVYIRLRKRVDTGRWRFYLIFHGHHIDKQILTGTSREMKAMRRLGQQLAANLNLNYFDEANISEHHVIRHGRPDSGDKMRARIQGMAPQITPLRALV